jgi:DNA-binding NarL/FixJ family response regulator
MPIALAAALATIAARGASTLCCHRGRLAMKVLLVDDHPLILEALQTVIRGLGDDVTVAGVDNADAAHAALQSGADFDLVLLALALGDTDGFDVLADMRRRYPALPVVVVSATERSSDVIRAIDMGAMGFVPKRSSNRDLFDALAMVMSGGVYIPPMILGLVNAPPPPAGDTVPDVMRPVAELAQSDAAQQPPSLETLGLTRRQADVLALLLQGLPNRLIARELNVSVETIKDHVAAVLRALGVSSRTQAVLAVSQMTQSQIGFAARKIPPR